MKIKQHIFALMLFTLPVHSNASLMVTGVLSYDNISGVITNTVNNNMYLGWDIFAGVSYADVLTQLGAGGSHEGWRIAKQVDAYDFITAAGYTQISNQLWESEFLPIPDFNDGELFGNNDYAAGADYAFFESDIVGRAGTIEVNSFIDQIYTDSSLVSYASAEAFVVNDNDTWLITKSGASISEPTILALMGLGILGIFGLNRCQHRAKYHQTPMSNNTANI